MGNGESGRGLSGDGGAEEGMAFMGDGTEQWTSGREG